MIRARALSIVAVLLVASCSDKVSHENIDKWMQTENGPDKLKSALGNASIDPDLSAHAAANLMMIRDDAAVREVMGKLAADRRALVIGKLAPRLWELARIEGEMAAPTDQQTAAKDLLYDLRAFADDANKQTIDGYLVEWYTSGYYEGRAETGRWSGAQVMRAIGKSAGAGMIKAANQILGAPPTADGRHLKMGDDLLLGLAVTGDPAAVQYLCDLFSHDKEKLDKTLPERAMAALVLAYAEPPGQMFDKADPAGLVPNLGAIGKVILDPDRSNHMINDAVEVLGAAGAPACIDPLVAVIDHPHSDPRIVWVGTDNALRCGGIPAIAKVAHALPEGGEYEHEDLEGSVIGEIAKMQKDGAAAAARDLLADKSWVARWIAVEVLAKIGGKDDAAKVGALSGDKAVLHGYWGDQSDLDKADRKAEPTLGQRAAEVAKALGG